MLRLALVAVALSGLVVLGCGTGSRSASATVAALAASIQPTGEGGPTVIEVSAPPAVQAAGGRRLAEFRRGRTATAQSGCLACHRIGTSGNRGPGANLTHVGSMLSRRRIERALVKTRAPMPSFKRLPAAKLRAIATFLSLLRR